MATARRALGEIYKDIEERMEGIKLKALSRHEGSLVRTNNYRDVTQRVFDYAAHAIMGEPFEKPTVPANFSDHIALMADAEESVRVFKALRRVLSNTLTDSRRDASQMLGLEASILRIANREEEARTKNKREPE